MMHQAEPDAPRDSIECGAVVFSQTKEFFTPAEFAEFLAMAGVPMMEPEAADEFLSDLADKGTLRQIGPGVYAKAKPGDTKA